MKNPSDPLRDAARDVAPGGRDRRPYTTPRLTEYGPIAKLTRGSASGETELTPQGLMMEGMCL